MFHGLLWLCSFFRVVSHERSAREFFAYVLFVMGDFGQFHRLGWSSEGRAWNITHMGMRFCVNLADSAFPPFFANYRFLCCLSIFVRFVPPSGRFSCGTRIGSFLHHVISRLISSIRQSFLIFLSMRRALITARKKCSSSKDSCTLAYKMMVDLYSEIWDEQE